MNIRSSIQARLYCLFLVVFFVVVPTVSFADNSEATKKYEQDLEPTVKELREKIKTVPVNSEVPTEIKYANGASFPEVTANNLRVFGETFVKSINPFDPCVAYNPQCWAVGLTGGLFGGVAVKPMPNGRAPATTMVCSNTPYTSGFIPSVLMNIEKKIAESAILNPPFLTSLYEQELFTQFTSLNVANTQKGLAPVTRFWNIKASVVADTLNKKKDAMKLLFKGPNTAWCSAICPITRQISNPNPLLRIKLKKCEVGTYASSYEFRHLPAHLGTYATTAMISNKYKELTKEVLTKDPMICEKNRIYNQEVINYNAKSIGNPYIKKEDLKEFSAGAFGKGLAGCKVPVGARYNSRGTASAALAGSQNTTNVMCNLEGWTYAIRSPEEISSDKWQIHHAHNKDDINDNQCLSIEPGFTVLTAGEGMPKEQSEWVSTHWIKFTEKPAGMRVVLASTCPILDRKSCE